MTIIQTEHFEYQHADTMFDAAIISDRENTTPQRPTVLVFHGIEGRTEAQEDFAERLARQGYLGVAVDLFGRDATNGSQHQGSELMHTFLTDRGMLRERLLYILDVVRALPGVDPARMAATGFCFGGLCVLDLARAGTDVRGVASFHGLLTPCDLTENVPISSKVAVFHGWDDPFAPPEDLVAFGAELTERGADWQVHAYGHAVHAFMAETANDPENGINHDPVTAARAWATLETFLAEVFG